MLAFTSVSIPEPAGVDSFVPPPRPIIRTF
jgi:hypothetical protein